MLKSPRFLLALRFVLILFGAAATLRAAPNTLEIVSTKDSARSDAPGTGDLGAISGFPCVSADGRYVAFLSSSTDLVLNQSSSTAQVFLRDRTNNTTQLLSGTGGSATTATGICASLSMSADGSSVVFTSTATDLVSPATTNTQVFLYHRDALGAGSLTLVSHKASSLTAGGTNASGSPMISRDGSTIVFTSISQANDLVSPYATGTGTQGFRYDVATGGITLATPKNGAVSSAQGIGAAVTLRAISEDGRWIGFVASATNAVSSVTAAGVKFFLFDSLNGTTQLLNRQYGTTATAANAAAGNGGGISSDGRYVTFLSAATDLISGQSGTDNQVFLYDRIADTITLISHSASDSTAGANAASILGNTTLGLPVISSNGRFVVFGSTATDLVSGYTGGIGTQFYLYDRLGNSGAGSITLITHTTASATVGSAGGVGISSASLSADGSRVVFGTSAADLVAGLSNTVNTGNVYAYTTSTGVITFVSGTATDSAAGSTAGGSFSPVLSDDGTFIAFRAIAGDLAANDTNGNTNDLFGSVQPQVAVTPGVYSAATASGTAGTAFSYTILATDTPTSYSLVLGTLPTGVTLNSSTGVVSGTPTQSGTFNVTLGATNAAGTGSFDLAITIAVGVPTVTTISLTTGTTAGGTSITLTGFNFTGATDVKFGVVSGTSLTVVSDSSITVTSPAGSAGAVDVTVTTPLGTSATSASDEYTYVRPAEFTYATNNGASSITGFTFIPLDGVVVIPDTINGDPVTSIAANAFDNCTSLTSVTIPDSVISIGESAFDDCSGLTSVTIGNGVTSIGNYAFVRDTSLTSVIIPDSVISLGESAFDDCSGLTSVTIGSSVTSIGNYAFVRCTGLTSVTIPDSVISIGNSAFEDCSGLISVTIGSSVTSIGDYVFVRCTSLTGARLPDSATIIGVNAFADCTSLVGPAADSVDVPVNGTYGTGQHLDFTLHYLENTVVTGTPSIGLTIGSTARSANYLSGSGTHYVLFRYTIQAGESDPDGIAADTIVTLNGGTIQNLAGVNAALTFSAPSTSSVLVDTSAPQITSIVRKTPTTQITRANPVVFTVTFSEAVTNVGTASFVIVPVNGGTTTATVASVTGGPAVYDVTANITGGAGDFRLDVGPVVTNLVTGFGNSSALAFDQAGDLYVADEGDNTIKKVTGGVVSTFASGFSSPYGMVFSPAGDLYVASYNQVKKVTSGGVVSTFATGFNVACGLAIDSGGNLYVGNFGDDTVSKVTGGGVVSTFATNINAPIGLTFDVAGNLYVASRDASVISKITPGGVVTTFASGLAGPEQLQFDAAGDLFVADRWADRIVRVKPDGTVSTYAANISRAYGLVFDAEGALYVSSYYSDNTVRKLTLPVITDLASNAVPGLPYNLGETYTYDPNDAPTDIQLSNASATEPAGVGAMIGTLSTTDADGADVHTYTLVSGTDDTDNGSFSINGNALQVGAAPLAAGFYSVRIQTDDGQGGTYAESFVIAVGVPQITSVVRKTPSAQVTGANALVFEVTFSEPVTGVGTGGFAVTPINGSTVTGTVTSVSGGPSVYAVAVSLTGGTGDFRLDAVLQSPIASTFASGFSSPSALAFDGAGNLFVANNGANTVSKVTSGGDVSVFASGFSGPTGLAIDALENLYVANRWSGSVNLVTSGGSVSVFASGFQQPSGLAFDGAGKLYVSTGQNNSVSQVTSGGVVSGFSSGFNGPTAMAFDAAGNLFVGNQWNNSVSKVTSDGNGSFYTDGFNGAAGLAFDGAGNLYVANNWNNTVSKVTRAKVVSTFAAGINAPTGLAFDSAGNLFVASQTSGTITRLVSASIKDLTGTELSGLPFSLGETYTIVPNAVPTDIALSNSSVNQSGGADASVGMLSTMDADDSDTHTYTLVSGAGDTDNTSFAIASNALSVGASPLAAGTYSVRIETSDGNGGTYGEVFAIVVVDNIAPNAPSLFSAGATGSAISLSWVNPVSDFASCTIRRSTSAFPTSVTDGTAVASGQTGTSYSNTGLADGTYNYAIFALDAAGNVSSSATASATVDTTAPAAPAAFTAVATGSTIALSWTNPVSDFASCTIRRSTSAYPTSNSDGTAVASGQTDTSFNNTGLADGTYYFALFALDAVGNVSVSATASATVDTTPPAAPDLSAVKPSATGSTIDLTWTVPSTTATFTLRRSTTSAPASITDGTLIQSNIASSTTSFSQTGLADGTYYYTIFALDAAGNVSNAGTASAVTIDTTAPTAPTTLVATATGATIALTWTNPVSDFASCTLRRSTSAYPTSVTDGTAVFSNSTATSFSNTGLTDGTYYYALFALDAVGNVSNSATASATVDTTATSASTAFTAVATGSTVALSWTNPTASDFASCTIRRSTSAFPTSVTDDTAVGSSLTGTTLNQTSLADGTYYYAIFALDVAGNVSNRATATATVDTTAPAAPSTPATATNPTSNVRPAITGTAEAGSAVQLYDGATLIGMATATGGDWSITPGADLTISTHTLTATATDSSGNISTVSGSLVLLIGINPAFSTHPTTQTKTVGAAATFTVVVSGTPAPTLQWKKDGIDISGATGASYTIASPLVADGGAYTVVATNSVGIATSNPASLTIAKATPVITWTAPAGIQYGTALSGAQLSATASTAGSFAYSPASGTVLSPGIQTLSVAFSPTDTINYTGATAQQSVTVTSLPSFSTQPADRIIAPGESAIFSAVAGAYPVPTYQWQLLPAGSSSWINLTNGGSYSGTTTATLLISNATLGMNGNQLRGVATNLVGAVASNAALLTVTTATIAPGEAVISFTVE